MGSRAKIINPLCPAGGLLAITLHHPSRSLRCGRNLDNRLLLLPSPRPSSHPLHPLLLSTLFHQPSSSNHFHTQHGNVSPSPTCSLSLSRSPFSVPSPHSNSFDLGFLLSAFPTFRYQSSGTNGSKSDPKEHLLYRWRKAGDPIDGSAAGFSRDRGSSVTVVLLGWLGGQPKHLYKYSNLYASRGFNVVTLSVPVTEVVGFDLGRKIEGRIKRLADDLAAWLTESEKRDGKEHSLVFHAFSNTGWLVFGTILRFLQDRPEIVKHIKGLMVDSGAGSVFDPKVWAAGFGTAILKKRNTSISTAAEAIEMDPFTSKPRLQEQEPQTAETLLLFILEQFFSLLLQVPAVRSKLTATVFQLSENVHCPQLYLYSTADKVVPWHSVEMFAEEQMKKGRKVWTFNFKTSPHVDHYRNFASLYSEKVNSFLDECLNLKSSSTIKSEKKINHPQNV